MSKKTGVGACGRMSRGSAAFVFAFDLLYFYFFETIIRRRFVFGCELIVIIIVECLSLSLSLSSPTTKNAHAQLNGSTRPKGLGSSSPTTGAKKSSCTNRTWKRRDSAVYERYVLIWDPKRLEVTLLFWIQGEKVEFDVDAPEGERTKAINVTGPEGANVLGATRKYRRSKGGGGGNPTTTNEDAPDIGAPE